MNFMTSHGYAGGIKFEVCVVDCSRSPHLSVPVSVPAPVPAFLCFPVALLKSSIDANGSYAIQK